MDEASIGDELASTIHNAVHQILAKYGGGMVRSFEFGVSFIDANGEEGWATAHGPKQTMSDTLGLLEFHRLTVERQVYIYLGEESE